MSPILPVRAVSVYVQPVVAVDTMQTLPLFGVVEVVRGVARRSSCE